jgi:hypothetical protein
MAKAKIKLWRVFNEDMDRAGIVLCRVRSVVSLVDEPA